MTTDQNINTADAELAQRISRALEAKGKKGAVQTLVREGYVRLLGLVDGPREKEEISGWVEAVPGVKMVTNHLKIRPREGERVPAHF